MGKKVMIIGSGAREHAIAAKYAQGDSVNSILVTPGNEGMLYGMNDVYKVGIDFDIGIDKSTNLKDPSSFLRVAQKFQPDLIDVAQDDALAAGTVDLLTRERFKVFGPTKEASRIEWDKLWARDFMRKYGLPIPEFRGYSKGDVNAISYAHRLIDTGSIAFFKASGLFAGKGVKSVSDHDKVQDAFDEIQNMGSASEIFVVEKGLVGEEFSYYAIVNGNQFRCFNSAQDNKRAFNRDQGENTGGMGSNSPALVTKGLEKKIEEKIIRPTVEGMAKEGIPFTGILYLGGMIDKDGEPWVVEFNSRWGDPECQVVLPAYNGDYYRLVTEAMQGRFPEKLPLDRVTRVCIVGASAGYPGHYEKGRRIFENDRNMTKGVYFLSAGIRLQEGQMLTDGGRVFNIIAEGSDIIEARSKALQAMACYTIEKNGLHYRTDIAWRDVERVLKK